MQQQLSIEQMEQAVKGIHDIAHPLRLRILEYLDIHGTSSVSAITKGIGEEQITVSQNLKKMRDTNLVKTTRKGIFIYYELSGEYPASLFFCIRKLYGYMTDDFRFLADGAKLPLPRDFIVMTANHIKLFAHIDKIRILEYLTLASESCVSDIVKATGISQLKTSQYLKRLKDGGFVKSRKDGRFVFYEITTGIHKTVIQCIHRHYGLPINNEEDHQNKQI